MGAVTGAVKGMSDLKALSREEEAAHFNVWSLAGYLPASLRRAETVMIAKEASVLSPEKHSPITISDNSNHVLIYIKINREKYICICRRNH